MTMTMSFADRPQPSRRRSGSAGMGVLGWVRRKMRARPWSSIAHLAFAMLALVAIVNAVWWQNRDPERASLAAGAAPSPPVVAPPPAPPVRPAVLTTATPSPQPARAVPGAPSVAPPPPPATTAAAPARPTPPRDVPVADPLGDLIRTGQVQTAARGADARTAEARPADTRPVLAAQRALNRLGYGPIRADGVFGDGTRAAIERFERDKRLPVTRDLSARTLRELAAASGQRLD